MYAYKDRDGWHYTGLWGVVGSALDPWLSLTLDYPDCRVWRRAPTQSKGNWDGLLNWTSKRRASRQREYRIGRLTVAG